MLAGRRRTVGRSVGRAGGRWKKGSPATKTRARGGGRPRGRRDGRGGGGAADGDNAGRWACPTARVCRRGGGGGVPPTGGAGPPARRPARLAPNRPVGPLAFFQRGLARARPWVGHRDAAATVGPAVWMAGVVATSGGGAGGERLGGADGCDWWRRGIHVGRVGPRAAPRRDGFLRRWPRGGGARRRCGRPRQPLLAGAGDVWPHTAHRRYVARAVAAMPLVFCLSSLCAAVPVLFFSPFLPARGFDPGETCRSRLLGLCRAAAAPWGGRGRAGTGWSLSRDAAAPRRHGRRRRDAAPRARRGAGRDGGTPCLSRRPSGWLDRPP